MVYNLH